jgi:DMSO/TMAO reductase YedYZ molybdopterin-dependent catalytic subunit
VLLFATGEWTRLIPTSWSIIPDAWNTLLTYLTLHIPPTSAFNPYDPLQQLAYAAVVFLLAPFMLLTGAAMSPSIEARFPWYVRLFGGKQGARSLHFLSLVAFVLFIIVHTALVLIVHFQDNIRNIVFGTEHADFVQALLIALIALAAVAVIYVLTTWWTLRKRRRVQHALGVLVDPVRLLLLHKEESKQHYKISDITPYFWVNGYPPEDEEFKRLAQNNFIDWRLAVCGLVANPHDFSLTELYQRKEQMQITKHNCIQGWSGVAEWGGVCLTEMINLVGVKPEARYAVFTSYQKGKQSVKPDLTEAQEQTFYEVLEMDLVRHPQTILAYEMNGQPLPIEHGAPVRLRVESLLGYKMVKYLRSIEFVEDYRHIGEGQGGFREDFQYYGTSAEI